MAGLRRIISLLWPGYQQTRKYGDVPAMYNRGDFAGAYAAFRDCIRNLPESYEDADLYIMWADLELRANVDLRKARELLDKALRTDSYRADYYYYAVRGNLMWHSGEYERAVRDMEKSVEADPDRTYLITLAACLSHLDDKRALSAWHQVLERDPSSCVAHVYIGMEAAKSGDRETALLMAKEAERLDPSVEEVFEIGLLYYELEKFETAIDRYFEAERLGYGHKGRLYASIAASYCLLGDTGATRKYIERAVRCSPEDDYVNELRRECEQRLGG